MLRAYLPSFGDELAKIAAEFAPGIPSKKKSFDLPALKEPAKWEYAVHEHKAEKRGLHYDIRLGDPETGHAHSWAMPVAWPKPGESAWAIQQPTHTIEYMNFEGRIPSGYGKGDVALHTRDKVEVTASGPGHINFNLYKNTGPEEYTLHRIADKKWKLINRTPYRDHTKLPDTKPKYKETDITKADKHIDSDEWIASAKIDDAHNLFVLPASGQQIRSISYRVPKKGETGIIDHTHKVPALAGIKTPKNLGGTILRGGLYATDPETGKATPAKDLASLLNTNVWKSREKQKSIGELKPVVYDVVQYKGKNVEKAPYEEKLKILREITAKLPLEMPRTATTPEEKRKLISQIEAGGVPETKEGVVFWNLKKPVPAVKAKFKTDHDVYVRDFFPGGGKYHEKGVGGFTFSHEPDGPIVGRVGTGLSDELRHDMYKHPDRYKGLAARVVAQEKFQSGALRAPTFEGWHLDKNDPADLSKVKF